MTRSLMRSRLNSSDLTLSRPAGSHLEEEREISSDLNSTQLNSRRAQLNSTREEITREEITRDLEPAGPAVLLLEVLRGASSRGDLEVIGGGAREIKIGPASQVITK